MILVAILLAVQTMPPPSDNDDIVVTGRPMERLKRLRMTTKLDRKTGVTRCIFKRRSGDPALDAAVCNAILTCGPKVATVEEMNVCIAPTMDALVAQGVPWSAKAAEGAAPTQGNGSVSQADQKSVEDLKTRRSTIEPKTSERPETP